MLATNPADVVVPPRAKRSEMKVPDETQAAAMLRAAEGTGLYMALLLAVGTGMRKGELLATRWSDVDLEAGTLTVSQTLQAAFGELHFKEPKTATSRRAVTLPGVVVEVLRAHRAEQAKKTLAREPGYALSDLVLAGLAAAPGGPTTSTACGASSRRSRACRSASTTCATRTPPSCSKRRSSQGRLRAPRSRLHRHHSGHLLPRDAGHAGASSGEDRRRTAGGAGGLTVGVVKTQKTIETQRITLFIVEVETPGRRPGTRSEGHDT